MTKSPIDDFFDSKNWITSLKLVFWLSVGALVFGLIYKLISTIRFDSGTVESAELTDVHSETTRQSVVGRGIVGGLIGGDMGMLLGALSAREFTKYIYVFTVRWKGGRVSTEECRYQDAKYNRLIQYTSLHRAVTGGSGKAADTHDSAPQKAGSAGRSHEYRLCSSKRSAANVHGLISGGDLRSGTPLRIQLDGENEIVKLYSENGMILGHLAPPDAIKVLDRYADGTAFCAAAGKVDLTACIIKTVKITELK